MVKAKPNINKNKQTKKENKNKRATKELKNENKQ